MAKKLNGPPLEDEFEVSVFGPGFGEAILIHLGGGNWVSVDSCKTADQTPAAISYLTQIGIDPANAIKLIVITHGDNDHIQGIAKVVETCASAKVCVSAALTNKEYLLVAGLYGKRNGPDLSGVDELSKVYRLLDSRKNTNSKLNVPKPTSSGQILFSDEIVVGNKTAHAEVLALSPSGAAVAHSAAFFSNVKTTENQNSRIPRLDPNLASVVLWIQVDDHKILLAADLENTIDEQTGWTAILDDSVGIKGLAGLFKIPHHGSSNAHNERVWSDMTHPQPFAVLTPFRYGSTQLPTKEDMRRIRSFTPNGYITSDNMPVQKKFNKNAVTSLVKRATHRTRKRQGNWGQVRFRQKLNGGIDQWRAELFGAATTLSK